MSSKGSRFTFYVKRNTHYALRITFYILFVLFVLPQAAQTATLPPVVINEIQYHPASDVYGEEYIELHNAGTTSVDLTGWQVSDGIVYTFPTGTVMLPGDYLVIASNPAAVMAAYGITGTLGPFVSGKLSNSGERVAIEDADGALVDVVVYDDHTPWPEAADGDGPSLELINPTFNNLSPCSWASSSGLGTPGAQNSTFLEGNIPPCAIDTAHTPVMPRSNQPVTVTVFVDDNSVVASVMLYYRVEGESAYQAIAMTDDSSGADEDAGDGVYTAVILPRSLGETIFPLPGQGVCVEFYVTATDDEGAARTVPDGAPGGISAETGGPVTVSYLYWVEDVLPEESLPLYRILITSENWTELLTRDLDSNVLLDTTFVYEGEIYYNVGLRYRGESSRDAFPRPYRIRFNDSQEFESRERINLISDELHREALTHDLFQRAGLFASDTRFVAFYVNGHREGAYLDVEQVDRDFLKAHFSDDDNGNLYRGVEHADLVYYANNLDHYRQHYVKKTNEDADDYTDVISLTYTLTHAPDSTFFAEADAVADMRQWLKWFAMQAVLDNHEGALWIGPGDDYFLYHRPSDDRFVLIPWDHDATFTNPSHTIWEFDWYAKETVKRILHTTQFTRWYYQGIAEIISGPFAVSEMFPRIDALPDVVSAEDKQELRDFVEARIPSLWMQIPGDRLLIVTNGGENIVTTQATMVLEGTCSPLRDVTVNGSPEGLIYLTPTSWRYVAPLTMRDNVFVVADGEDTDSITVFRDLFHGGTLTESTVLPGSALPYTIKEDIQLSGNLTLTIEAGATLVFDPDRVLRVENGARLLVAGSPGRRVVFTGNNHQFWGGILLYSTQADNRIEHAVLEDIHEVIRAPRTHGVTAFNSHITIAESILRHMRHSTAVTADYDSTLYLLRNDIYDIGTDAVHATGGYAYIQGNKIHDVVYDLSFNPSPPEGIEISHMGDTPAVLLDNVIYNITDDCLDVNHSSATIERNILHHCGDKGISVGHPSSSTIVNNLIYECRNNANDPDRTGFGIALKDGAVARLVNNTLVNNTHGLGLYEMHADEGGAMATLINSIVWGNDVGIVLRDGSSLEISYSHVQGDWSGESVFFDVDPQFRNAANHNYRLRETSPCVDTGTADGAPSVDVHRVARPQGGGYDRGAYEFFEFFSVYMPLILR